MYKFLSEPRIFSFRRCFSSTTAMPQKSMSASHIRQMFLEYFKQQNHQVIPSSSVKPSQNDPSLSFVNAGMNQFKKVFQNREPAKFPRIANSQKCVRVGGKHNDLSVVGKNNAMIIFGGL